ncbi:patatin-like phospholipase family protein [Mesorhizobium sp. M0189]|uniref:patatin-like phospholipase family protein n=1 Tax=Mesorhizobium sp. M0189 TaxID=2956909 RepID=UPI00333D729F
MMPVDNGDQTVFGEDDVLKEELIVLRGRELRTDSKCEGSTASEKRRDYLIGLGLSGGGIRSACVSLGVLQVLAAHKMLKHFDYLSTVSGGGYIGAALALRYAQKAHKESDPDAAFPYADERTGEIEHLRHHATYLAPRGVRSFATGFVVVARSLILNTFIWIVIGGIVLALLMLPLDEGRQCWILPDTLCTAKPNAFFDWLLVLAAGLGLVLLALMAGASLSSWWVKGHRQPQRAWWIKHVLLPAVISVLLLIICYAVLPQDAFLKPSSAIKGHHVVLLVIPVGLLLAIVVPFLGPKFPRWFLLLLLGTVSGIAAYHGSKSHALWALALTSGAATVFVLWNIIPANNNNQEVPHESVPADTDEFTNQVPSHKYMRRRFLDSWSGALVVVALACGVVGLVPMTGWLLQKLFGGEGTDETNYDESLISLINYMGAAASALYGYYQAHLRKNFGIGTAFVVVVGSVLLCFATLVFAHRVALDLVDASRSLRINLWTLPWHQGVPLAAAIAALALGFFVNTNDLALGRFYRDRLMEAFMPNLRQGVGGAVQVGHDQPASTADRYRLSAIAHDHPLLGPYPLINTNVLARRSPDFRQRRRGGANFVLSPRYCGSDLTGWKHTSEVLDDQLTVPTAMAISGAAVNPGGGLAGQGVTTNYGVAVAMSLLGLRLGYHFRWHDKGGVAHVARRFLNPFGNHFIPAASEIGAELLGMRSHHPNFVELSDGGHFENLGLYELVRRRCGLVVIVDGGEEPGASYAAFTSAMTLIREDFGATIELDPRATPAQVVARSVDNEYPRAAEFANRGYFLASIRYAASDQVGTDAGWPQTGLLIYLKSAMIKSLPISVRGYKGANPDFPYQSTADQFFSPEQFEAYRQLGIGIAEQMLDETKLGELFAPEESSRPTFGDLTARFVEQPDLCKPPIADPV